MQLWSGQMKTMIQLLILQPTERTSRSHQFPNLPLEFSCKYFKRTKIKHMTRYFQQGSHIRSNDSRKLITKSLALCQKLILTSLLWRHSPRTVYHAQSAQVTVAKREQDHDGYGSRVRGKHNRKVVPRLHVTQQEQWNEGDSAERQHQHYVRILRWRLK